MWSRASPQGSYSHAARPGHINVGGGLVPADEVIHGWISGAHIKEVVSYKFAKQEHINLLEMQAQKTWILRASKSPACGPGRLCWPETGR